MKALIKIKLPNLNYDWLKKAMADAGFLPAKLRNSEARYYGPDYEFYWSGAYEKEDLHDKIAKIFAQKNNSLAAGMSPASGEWTITSLN